MSSISFIYTALSNLPEDSTATVQSRESQLWPPEDSQAAWQGSVLGLEWASDSGD